MTKVQSAASTSPALGMSDCKVCTIWYILYFICNQVQYRIYSNHGTQSLVNDVVQCRAMWQPGICRNYVRLWCSHWYVEPMKEKRQIVTEEDALVTNTSVSCCNWTSLQSEYLMKGYLHAWPTAQFLHVFLSVTSLALNVQSLSSGKWRTM